MLKFSIYEKLLSLPVNEVQLLDSRLLNEEGRTVIELRIRKRRKTADCAKCKKRTKKLHERKIYVKNKVKHIFTSDNVEVRLALGKRRFRCCGDTFLEKYSFERDGWYTEAFENHILREWKHLSVLEISRRTGVSDFRLWSIIRNVDTKALAEKGIEWLKGLDEIHLGIDGHSFRGHDMVLMVNEIKTGKVIAILEKESNECIKEWLNTLTPSILAKIKSFVIDMKVGMKYTVKKTIGGNVTEVVDHYHIVQEANKMVDEVRQLGNWLRREVKREMRIILKKAKKEERKMFEHILQNGEIQSYVEIKQRRVFLKAEERLTPEQENLVGTLLRRCKYLREAWLNKELLRESFQTRDESLLKKVTEDCLKSEQYRIRQFGRTLKRWFQEILNFFKLNVTNAFTEGLHNKVKVMKRIAYGYRNKESYIRKLYFSL